MPGTLKRRNSGVEKAKRNCSSWMIFPGIDALRPYNIIFNCNRFEQELCGGLDYALSKSLVPEEIVGACKYDDEIVYFIKWKHQVAISYISSRDAKRLYSEAVIKFHEKYNTSWQRLNLVTNHGNFMEFPIM